MMGFPPPHVSLVKQSCELYIYVCIYDEVQHYTGLQEKKKRNNKDFYLGKYSRIVHT